MNLNKKSKKDSLNVRLFYLSVAIFIITFIGVGIFMERESWNRIDIKLLLVFSTSFCIFMGGRLVSYRWHKIGIPSDQRILFAARLISLALLLAIIVELTFGIFGIFST